MQIALIPVKLPLFILFIFLEGGSAERVLSRGSTPSAEPNARLNLTNLRS